MRLIDADALRKAFHNRIYYFDKSSWDEANALIDNSPTVEEKSYSMGYQDGAEDGLQDIRPHGKWEEDWQEDLDFMSRKGWKCPFCKWRTTYGTPNFCMNCGADLREERSK